jgi:hypothetical protein
MLVYKVQNICNSEVHRVYLAILQSHRCMKAQFQNKRMLNS